MAEDVEFGVIPGSELVTEAIVALSSPTRTTWPLDEVNAALADLYRALVDGQSLATPQIYPVWTFGEVVGYLVMPERNNVSGAEITEAFWGILGANEMATVTPNEFWGILQSNDMAGEKPDEVTYRFSTNPPFYIDGTWDDIPVGVVAYPHPYGPPLPTEAINHGLVALLGQDLYPLADMQPYLYRVGRDGGDRTFGLLIAENQGEIGNEEAEIEGSFRAIHSMNSTTAEHVIPEEFRRKRMA